MTVYVDPTFRCVRSNRWPFSSSCHLFADAPDELHKFAASLGLRRWMFQSRDGFPHYDLTVVRRAMAVEAGAVEATARQTVEFARARSRTEMAAKP